MIDPMLEDIIQAFQTDPTSAEGPLFQVVGEGTLPSFFAVTELAAASVGMAGAMLARFAAGDAAEPPAVTVDRRLASLWFHLSLRPIGWALPPIWDSVAGDYRTKDGWIRLHTNAPHHRAAAMRVIGGPEEREAAARAVSGREAAALETAVVEAGGAAAEMRSLDDWARHPQGAAVASEPLVIWEERGAGAGPARAGVFPRSERPLEGLRVLDLTRVLAGPAATRFLAAFGADVLRIDPPSWDEAAAVPEMTLGKRCSRLDLRQNEHRAIFERLLGEADVLVHGYRAEALAGLGYGQAERHALNPGLIDVALNAYGWSGPWSNRRGFDSLVQMSSGIAEFGMISEAADRPVPLPAQALDHATGYLMAAAVLKALIMRREQGRVLSARLSLARTAHLLAATATPNKSEGLAEATDEDFDPRPEQTAWGSARRLRFPLTIDGCAPTWPYPAGPLGASSPTWAGKA